MPRFFFHLSFGDRICRDEEGFDFPNRTAARAEAFAVIRDLGHGRAEENGRAWAGWTLHIADAGGQFFSLPIDQPLLAIAADRGRSKSRAQAPLESRLAKLAAHLLQIRRRTMTLMEENRQLRVELASELQRGERIRAVTQRLLAGTRVTRLEAAGVSDFRDAPRPPRRSRPHLVLVGGKHL